MNYKQTAADIVHYIGGKENISHLEHCSTRLRFTLKDDGLTNIAALEKVDGVMGIRQNVQTQVIIGNEVNEVYDEVQKLIGTLSDSGAGPKKKHKLGSVVLDFIVSVFQPLVPALAGGGVLKSLLMLISMLGWMDTTSSTYQILTMVGDASLYFLPILVAITTANKLKVNALVAVSAAGALVLPNMATMLGEGTTLFSIGVENIAYAYQVFPAILSILFYSQMEKFFTKYSPKAIRIFFVPMMSLVITVPVTLLLLGPLGFNIGQGFSAIILFLFEHFGWVATALLAAVLPFMVATGMHKAMVPYAVSSMSELGRELLYLPASLAHNISEAGACFAVALRTKDNSLRATAISAGISALFGITEPALYGVTILHKRVLYGVVVGSLIGGAFIGIVGIQAFALVGPGLASITMYADPDNSMNLIYAFAAVGISFVISFGTTFFLWKDAPKEKEKQALAKFTGESADYLSPVEGEIVPLAEVNDDVFSNRLVGDGLAIIPKKGVLYAPTAGTVTMIFDTKHAIGMQTEDGADLLFHIGLDTVQLNGQYFTALVAQGEKVAAGTPLIDFDIEKIQAAGFDPIVIAVVTNKDRYRVEPLVSSGPVNNKQVVMTVGRGEE